MFANSTYSFSLKLDFDCAFLFKFLLLVLFLDIPEVIQLTRKVCVYLFVRRHRTCHELPPHLPVAYTYHLPHPLASVDAN